ncbi:hypothetical protein M3196_00160 [Fictibacillus nanhaiensis]|uniref:hypothetical protein n=1 Tax=Fictibacillus nanhaiensis TaxID=742169 RepID=UPI00203DC6CF|nr:hypothetical protein [Fictibacillus nanhaiensis]MCM3730082.1 hypothetical protein [Fictibacillus nanhaiensis]
MKQIGKKVYFDKSNGKIIQIVGEMQGSVTETTIEEDIVTFTALSDRNRETFDVLELPFGAYAQDFAEGRLIGIDIETKLPIFEYLNPEDPANPIIPEKPLTVQIAELRERDAAMQDDQIFIMEVLASNNLV